MNTADSLQLQAVTNPGKWVLRLLIALQLILVPPILKSWLYVATYRLYVDDRLDPGPQDGMVWQQFNILDDRVVPQIFVEGTTHLRFPVHFPNPSTLWMASTSTAQVAYEVHLIEGGVRRLLYKHDAGGPANQRLVLPKSNGVLEISSQGSAVWSDLRIVHGWRATFYILVFCAALVGSILLARILKPSSPMPVRRREKVFAFMAVAIAGSCLLTLGILEVSMQLLGAPAPIRTLRRELGEVSPDPQWENSEQYGTRLRPSQNTILQWREGGDIARMGFIPVSALLSPPPDKYSLLTDSEGFRNSRVRESIHVATLGDSFTDALTLPVEQIWSSLLERRLGLPVQNYGTAGFGPQQELKVLREYAIRHHPRVVVLAYFAGNDIFNAENFDRYEKSEGSIALPMAGWSIKKVVPRYETLYTFSLLRLALNTLRTQPPDVAQPAAQLASNTPSADRGGGNGATFDRGLFTVPVNERTLQFALMPPYLQTLTLSEAAIEKRSGWQLTRKSIVEMNQTSRDSGATLVVLFIPFKSQVYLPILERSFNPQDLERDFQFYFRQLPTRLALKEMSANRLAQNNLMRRLCEDEHILLIDPTAGFQAEVDAGRNMYFADDSHWNAAGHEFAADAIAAFLKSHGLDRN